MKYLRLHFHNDCRNSIFLTWQVWSWSVVQQLHLLVISYVYRFMEAEEVVKVWCI